MAWTAPRTFVTDEVVSASQLNAHVRDNMLETAPAKAAAAGDLFQASAANAIAVLPLGTEGYRLGAGGSAVQYDGFANPRKRDSEQKTSDTSLSNDGHLFFAIAANENWMFQVTLFVDGTTNADIKTAFTVPSGATLVWSGIGLEIAASDGKGVKIGTTIQVSGTSAEYGLLGVGTKLLLQLWGTVINAGNAGNVQLQWAQVVSDGSSTTVFINSWLRAEQIP